jgi:magnesium transporter
VPENARWVDLLDPDRATLEKHLPVELRTRALERLLEKHEHGDEPRPSLETHGDYVLGVFLVAVDVPDENRIYYQELELIVTPEVVVTVRKTPPRERPFDPEPIREACDKADRPGLIAYHVVDEIAERYLDLVDDLNDEIDELEDTVEETNPREVRARLRALRHDMLRIRRTLTPTRDAVHRVLDDRVELDAYELFPDDVERHFADVYDKLLRATEALELSRDLLGGVRDYAQAKIANDQNEVMKRLTVIASLLLLPTFIVGLYGQNFRHHFPELDWQYGYAFSWALIVGSTIAQLAFYRWKRWI